MDSPGGEPVPEFVVAAAERKACDVTYENGRLRVRVRRAQWAGIAVLVVLGLAFAVLSATLGPVGVVFAAFGLWMAASALVVMAGQVVASGDGLSVRWLRTREIPRSSVDHFAVERRVRWWVPGRFWPPPEVVEVALRPGERVKLWSTIGIREGRLGATNPTAATLMRGLLQRYRDAFAPSP